jgi:hypothetical protein
MAPEPFVPANTDVSSLARFMLNIEHLLASELVATASPEECWAALMLWCHAWKQVPAGSLPNDDRVLTAFSRAGRRWAKVRAKALHGFVLCSDGRLYHPFLCAEVLRAEKTLKNYYKRREADRARLEKWRGSRGVLSNENSELGENETRFETQYETRFETHVKRLDTIRDDTIRYLQEEIPPPNPPPSGRGLSVKRVSKRKRSDVEAIASPPWPQRCRVWVESGFWKDGEWGPPPSEPGCWAPAVLAAEARQMRNGAAAE